jgi:hypothetical protein
MVVAIARPILISVFGLCVTCALMLSGCPRQRESLPAVDTKQTQNVFEFGRVRAGQTVVHIFTITNSAERTRVITQVQTTCGCTVVQPPKAEIPPKSKVELPVEMRTSGKSGGVAEHIRVQLDGGESEVFVLKGRVDPTHVAVLDLGQFRRGDTVRQAFTLHSPPDTDLRVLGCEFDERYLDVRVEPVRGATRGHEVMVSVAKDIPYGSFTEPILIRTTDSFEPDKRVSVKGNVLLPLVIEPRHVTLGMLRAGEVKNASVHLSTPYGSPLEIVGVEVEEGHPLSAAVDPISPTEVNLLLTVALDGERSVKVLKSVISVLARIGTAEERGRIEVYGIFQE